MEDYIVESLVEQLGLYVFKIEVLYNITKTTFIQKNSHYITTPFGDKYSYTQREYYVEEYIPQQKSLNPPDNIPHPDKIIKYDWPFEEVISFEKKEPDLKERRKYLDKIQLIKPFIQEYQIMFKAKWYGVALLENHLILF